MKEKILAILLATLMLLSLAACGEKTPAASSGKTEDTQNAVSTAIDAQMQSDDVKALIEANITAKMASDEIKATIKANTDAQMQTDTVQKNDFG